MDYRRYRINRAEREPLLHFILAALRECGCVILHHSEPSHAPFRISFETPDGERLGIIAYAFLANQRITRNRPADEHRFQVKYGADTGELHQLWIDPYGMYTTLFLGINPERGFFVAADPVLHNPTRFFISIEFKDEHVDGILRHGWYVWERERRVRGLDEPVETMVGGVPGRFLEYVRFERLAMGMDPGHRGLLGDKLSELPQIIPKGQPSPVRIDLPALHHLTREFELTQDEILDLIQSAPRLKMAVRGWVAEVHLVQLLGAVPEVVECTRLEAEGQPDVRVQLRFGRPILIECKNILRRPAEGAYRLDFQRTRASKQDPCSRYYAASDFDVVAACLHPRTERWEFAFALSGDLDPHERCPGKLSNRARLDGRWDTDALAVLQRACGT